MKFINTEMKGLKIIEGKNYYDSRGFFKEIFIKEYLLINDDKKSSDQILSDLIKKSIRVSIKSSSPKKPEVKAHIIRL